ncbi:MAG: hypothetical protein K2P65_08805, partial [Lachnospiraceae bacterium]|nr:hypothetical protein [Lachnospiraceae bacterium]
QANANSSIYNKNGFEFIIAEYTLNRKYLERKEREWHMAFYQKMLSQCLGRFRNMAVLGEFPADVSADMEILKDRLQDAVNEGLLVKDSLPIENWQKLQLLLQEPKSLYESYVEEHQKKENAVNELMNTIGDRKVVIFGCGKWGKFLHVLLEHRKPDSMVGYCDNLHNHKDILIQGKSVLKPKEAAKEYPDAVYVIASKYHTDEMKEQLCLLGISERNILQYIAEIDLRLLIL